MIYTLHKDEGMKHSNKPNYFDCGTWNAVYRLGYRKSHCPVPATLDNSDTALNYLMLRCAIGRNRLPCYACIDRFNDQIVWDNPEVPT